MGCGSSTSATPARKVPVNGSPPKKPGEKKIGRKVRPTSTDREKAVERGPATRQDENPKINVESETRVDANTQKREETGREIVGNPNPEVGGKDDAIEGERDTPEGCASSGKTEKDGGVVEKTDDPVETDENKPITMATEEERSQTEPDKESDKAAQGKESEVVAGEKDEPAAAAVDTQPEVKHDTKTGVDRDVVCTSNRGLVIDLFH
jgi:hypothetical protein